jgi:hypothetical protein
VVVSAVGLRTDPEGINLDSTEEEEKDVRGILNEFAVFLIPYQI